MMGIYRNSSILDFVRLLGDRQARMLSIAVIPFNYRARQTFDNSDALALSYNAAPRARILER